MRRATQHGGADTDGAATPRPTAMHRLRIIMGPETAAAVDHATAVVEFPADMLATTADQQVAATPVVAVVAATA